jgi:seryl-tRNA synthetase
MLKAKGEDTSAIEAEVRGINEQISALDVKAEEASTEPKQPLAQHPEPHPRSLPGRIG